MDTERRHTERAPYALLTPEIRAELHRTIEAVANRAPRTVWYCECCDLVMTDLLCSDAETVCKRGIGSRWHVWRSLEVNA